MALLQDVASNYRKFIPPSHMEGDNPLAAIQQRSDSKERYKVQVLVNNAGLQGAPVIFPEAISISEIFGGVEEDVEMVAPGVFRKSPGGPTFKAGAYHRAHQGFLILDGDVEDILAVWPAIKRALKSGKAEIPEAGARRLFLDHGKGYQVPAEVKVILIASPLLKMFLEIYDEDFREHFQVTSEFESALAITAETMAGYFRFMRRMATQMTGEVLHLAQGAIAGVLEFGNYSVEGNGKLTARFGPILNLLRESSYWAKKRLEELARTQAQKSGGTLEEQLQLLKSQGVYIVQREDVERAIEEWRLREGAQQRRMQELFVKNTLHMDTLGLKQNQINGMAIWGSFGIPLRKTAVISKGVPGLHSVERETRQGGSSFIRGLEEVEGYLHGTYGKLSLHIRIVVEQNYGKIDGDSGGLADGVLTELGLAGIPILQNWALTGSLDQHGNAQAIGGVNEKIIDTYDIVRKKRELTKEQPFHFIIPYDNVADLALRPDIVEAAGQGLVNIYAVHHVRQAEELVSGWAYADINRRAKANLNLRRVPKQAA
jgi:predicted ATP-dependent protease